MPELLGKEVSISSFVDANHTGNKIKQRFHTGIIIFISNALIQAFCKPQNTVEKITFGSELVVL